MDFHSQENKIMPSGLFDGLLGPRPPLDYIFVHPEAPGHCHCRRQMVERGYVSSSYRQDCEDALSKNIYSVRVSLGYQLESC